MTSDGESQRVTARPAGPASQGGPDHSVVDVVLLSPEMPLELRLVLPKVMPKARKFGPLGRTKRFCELPGEPRDRLQVLAQIVPLAAGVGAVGEVALLDPLRYDFLGCVAVLLTHLSLPCAPCPAPKP
jgi:hypothetical protein